MRISLATAAALLAVVALPCRAEKVEPVLALRLGIATATGDATADVPMSDAVRLQFPVQLDALLRLGPAAAGAYLSWGPARSAACGGACAAVTRAGLQAIWTFGMWGSAQPWAGLGAGYEWATERRAGAKTSWRGFEPFAAQGGLEWRIAPAIAVGPFLLVGAGRYTTIRVESPFDSASAELSRKTVHAWLHAGVRARLVMGGGR